MLPRGNLQMPRRNLTGARLSGCTTPRRPMRSKTPPAQAGFLFVMSPTNPARASAARQCLGSLMWDICALAEAPIIAPQSLPPRVLSDTKAMWEKAGRLPNAKMLAQVRAR
jgi:hypothetical protein